MDSANNSGSMQSSSGGDEEYDSRTEPISSFFTSSSSGDLPPPQPPPPPPSLHQNHPSPFFDSLSNFLDSNPNLPNLDMSWARPINPSPSSSSHPPITAQFSGHNITTNHPPPPPDQSTAASSPRNSKKRSRASRRAPTTVLTTDTSNFRAMVQEFTGIPAPPFSSSPFQRSRLDLFHAASAAAAAPSYLLRPFVQKVQAPPFGPIYSSTTTTTSTGANTNTATTNSTNITNNHHQLPSSDLGLSTQNQNLLNMQNPIFSFQSLLQPPPNPKYNSPTMPAFGARPQGLTMIPSVPDYGMNELRHVDAHLGSLSSLIGSEGLPTRGDGDDLSRWADGSGPDCGDDQGQFRPVVGNYSNSQRVSSCKLNYSASPSVDFNVEKGSENMPARGEGMVESWICSSD